MTPRYRVPSMELLAISAANELKCLTEGLNEGWNNPLPVAATRPQPDYAVGS